MEEFALILDLDEIVGENAYKLFEAMKTDKEIWSIRMIHLMNSLNQEDASVNGDFNILADKPHHIVLRRFFKITEGLFYPLIEHPVLQGYTDDKIDLLNEPIIWHFSDAKYCFELRNKYLNQLNKSQMHSKEYLDGWYRTRLFNTYPKKEITEQHPRILKEFFMI